MKHPIYAVTETNVDGCGGNATEYVEFSTIRPLDDEKTAIFQAELDAAKADAAKSDDDFSTADMIEDALESFGRKTGIHGEIVFSPFAGGFTF